MSGQEAAGGRWRRAGGSRSCRQGGRPARVPRGPGNCPQCPTGRIPLLQLGGGKRWGWGLGQFLGGFDLKGPPPRLQIPKDAMDSI